MAISTNGTVLTRLVGGLYNTTLSNASYTEAVANVKTSADINAFANDLYARDFAGKTDLAVANILLANLNLSSVTGLNNWVSAQLTAAGAGNKGAKLVSMLNDFANMTADATYGAYATAFNTKVEAALHLAQTEGSLGSDFSAAANPATQILTASRDTLTGNVFTAQTTLVNGSGYVNDLSDVDTLTGTGTNPTLNVVFGANNDISDDSVVQPKLNGIETINVEWTSNDTTTFDLSDSDSVRALNVNRITTNNAAIAHNNLNSTVTSLALNDATRNGAVTFDYREEVLTGVAETVALAINNVRLSSLTLAEGGDGAADQGYFFETVNVTTSGNNDVDTMAVQANGMEDTLLSLTAGTTKQTLNIVANGTTTTGSFEVNSLTASGVETMTIAANARVDIAANKMVALASTNDGISTADLETLTITGAANVMIDGLDTAKLATKTLTVNAGAMTGDLKLGVATASDASSSGTYATRTDKDLSVTSGSGNDQIVTYTSLAGDITTNAGNDTVKVGNAATAAASLDVEGVSTITTGEGNDTVVAKDLLVTATDKDQTTNTNFDDVTAATVSTGDGNDSVTVGALTSASDWDNITVTDGNLNDQQFIRGASVSTGAGADTVAFISVAEGASVNTGAGDDTVSVSLTATSTVLARDTAPDRIALVTATSGVVADASPLVAAGRTDEVSALGVVDRLGAIVDLGDGAADVISFTESDTGIADTSGAAPTETSASSYLLIDRDAELRGAETLNVTALDAVTVAVTTTMTDWDTVTTGVQNDINANVIGTVTANLTILNQVEDTNTADTVVAHNTVLGSTVNDNDATDGSITADVLRFDGSLAAINLVSHEQILETGAATEVYEAGTATAFTLQNMREGVALTLTAHEATGVASSAIADDNLIAINSSTGVVTTTAGAKDVTLTLNWDNSGESNDSASVSIGAAAGALSGTFDVLFSIAGSATTDTTDDTVSTADTSDKLENFTINVTDGLAHSFDMGSFADFGTATTSLTVNTGGASVAVDAVSVDRIAFNNAAGSAVTAANVTLRVNAGNNYNITTGSGNDIIDLRADDVQSDDGVANTTAADTINGGAGRDIMIVTGADSLGNNNVAGPSTVATQIDDDVFENINAVETILIDTATAGTAQDITLNEAAKDLGGVDTLRWVGTGTQTTNIVIGNDFSVVAGTGNGAFGDSAATGLVIDASAHTGATTLVIESKADDADQDVVNLDIRLSASGGADLTLVDAGVLSERVELSITTTATTNIQGFVTSGTAAANGKVKIVNTDTTTAIDKITMYEGTSATETENSSRDTVTIEADWTNDAGTFEFDASRLGNTDVATDTTGATGGMTFTVEAGDLADIIVRGGANSDSITTLAENDSIYGGGGADTILGAAGADVIYGEAGNDLIGSTSTTASESGNDTIDAGTGADTVYLAAGNDSISLGVDSDADNLVAYGTSNAAVATLSNSQASDTVTNFTSGTDKVTISLFANGTAGGDVINVSLFAVAADLAAGDNTLTGTAGAKVQGDGFYSTATSQLLIDLDGDGDITTNDLSIGISGAVAAADMNFVITGSSNADTITGGAGADDITGGAGSDKLTGGLGIDTFRSAGIHGQGTAASAVSDADTSTTVTTGDTLTFATTAADNVDRITDFAATDLLDVTTAATAPTTLVGFTSLTTALVSGTTYVAYGTYVASTGVFTIAAAYAATTAQDALLVVGNGTNTLTNTTGIVILDDLTAALAAANFV